jgi:hypothetical protein
MIPIFQLVFFGSKSGKTQKTTVLPALQSFYRDWRCARFASFHWGRLRMHSAASCFLFPLFSFLFSFFFADRFFFLCLVLHTNGGLLTDVRIGKEGEKVPQEGEKVPQEGEEERQEGKKEFGKLFFLAARVSGFLCSRRGPAV